MLLLLLVLRPVLLFMDIVDRFPVAFTCEKNGIKSKLLFLIINYCLMEIKLYRGGGL